MLKLHNSSSFKPDLLAKHGRFSADDTQDLVSFHDDVTA